MLRGVPILVLALPDDAVATRAVRRAISLNSTHALAAHSFVADAALMPYSLLSGPRGMPASVLWLF